MVNREPTRENEPTGVSRRRFLGTAGATGVALSIAGCTGGGGNGGGSGPIEITMDGEWVELEDQVTEALYDAGLDEDIEIDILPGDFDAGQRQADFTSALDAGRSSPDIFMMDSGWTIPFIVREQVVNLEEELPSETLSFIKDNYLDSAVQTASHPETGDLHGVPLFPDYPVMHYRKDLVEEAGYDPEGENWATEPMSWQAFAEMAADVWEQNGGEDEFTYAFTTQADNYIGTACCTFNEMMTSMGGAYFGDHGNLFGPVGDRPVTVNEQPVHDTLRMMRSFMRGPDAENADPDIPKISNTDLVEFTEVPSQEPFISGNAIFNRNWPFVMPDNIDEFGEGYDVMPLPSGVEEGQGAYEGTGGTAHALGGWHLTLNPNSQNRDRSVQVLEAFANNDVMRTNFEAGGYLPPNPEVTASMGADTSEIGRFLDTLAVAGENTVARPVTIAWPDQEPIVADQIHSVYTGDKSPEEAMGDLEEELQSIEENLA